MIDSRIILPLRPILTVLSPIETAKGLYRDCRRILRDTTMRIVAGETATKLPADDGNPLCLSPMARPTPARTSPGRDSGRVCCTHRSKPSCWRNIIATAEPKTSDLAAILGVGPDFLQGKPPRRRAGHKFSQVTLDVVKAESGDRPFSSSSIELGKLISHEWAKDGQASERSPRPISAAGTRRSARPARVTTAAASESWIQQSRARCCATGSRTASSGHSSPSRDDRSSRP